MEPAAAFHSVWRNQGGPSVCSLLVSIVVKDVQVERPKSGTFTMFFCREQGYWDLWRLICCFLMLALCNLPFAICPFLFSFPFLFFFSFYNLFLRGIFLLCVCMFSFLPFSFRFDFVKF
ncbi:hypothetical protein BO85DRAFT_209752 [Aspergillus piperis CBS 112811]|uniref:Uncharacterized protein n=1 Tax=Aspergillus piperis CBS 112811 TaxID=1448313 RepID=A0A8G1QU10_9EURO|nr:hypothetical protein BO85DRAFT_209752 [Aspergillus piperis CBS 112811]RAH52230.1 hypothetical protein BO85DRAFT_209752 [Aspergillus piperis CBS 112811]